MIILGKDKGKDTESGERRFSGKKEVGNQGEESGED